MVSRGIRPVVVAFFALATGLGVLPASAYAAGDSAETVSALCAALDAGDVDQASRLFADDGVVIQPRVGGLPQVAVGNAQIRWWLASLVDQHVRWGSTSPPAVVGNRIDWLHTFDADAFRVLAAAPVEVESEIMLTDNGQIESLSTRLTPNGARTLSQ